MRRVLVGCAGAMAALLAAGAAAAGTAPALPHAFETTVQFALERLESGTSARSDRTAEGAVAHVRPERTWRSVSGHWCREFSIRIEVPGSDDITRRAVRCRDGDGRWKPAGPEAG